MRTMANRLMLGTGIVVFLSLAAPAQAAPGSNDGFVAMVQAILEMFTGPEVGAHVSVLARQHNPHDDGGDGGPSPAPGGK